MSDSADSRSTTPSGKIIDIFTRRPWVENQPSPFVRLAPELDGLEMLYSNEAHPEKLFTLKVLCWGMRADGEVVGLVPWMNQLMPCTEIDDPLHGRWEGYFDPGIEEVFFDPPDHKTIELEMASSYYQYDCLTDEEVVQEIPDTIGTHAVMTNDGFHNIVLAEVVSWRLTHDGKLSAMLIDETKVASTPVLPGDPCLYPAEQREDFQYFFQHHIANKLKEKDPEAIAAIALLMDR